MQDSIQTREFFFIDNLDENCFIKDSTFKPIYTRS